MSMAAKGGYLSRDADKAEPLVFRIDAVIDDLAARQRGHPVKLLDRSGFTFNGPMVNGTFRHNTNRLIVDPLPKDNLVGHHVGFDFCLHLKVEDLQLLAR